MTQTLQDTSRVIYRTAVGDTLVVRRGVKTIVAHDLVQLRPTSAAFPYVYVTPFGDTVALEHNFRKFEPVKQVQIHSELFETTKPCDLPAVGDNRLSAEFITSIVHEPTIPAGSDGLATSYVFGIMLFATAYGAVTSFDNWMEMGRRIKLLLKG